MPNKKGAGEEKAVWVSLKTAELGTLPSLEAR